MNTMKRFFIKYLALLIPACTVSKSMVAQVHNPDFKQKIDSHLSYSVPVITVAELKNNKEKYVLLDARELEEYETSHIADARFFGYKSPQYDILRGIKKEQPIVLYCSIGVRSEKMGEKLIEQGYTNVKNLYGSIFEWANEGLPVVNATGKVTTQIHTYNKKWSKWLDNKAYEKVY
jgi:rhodanese-related sulfurtransferase